MGAKMKVRDEKYCYFSMFDGITVDDCLWFSNNTFNAICKCDLNTMETEVVGQFMYYEKYHQLLHRKVLRYGDTLFFVPHKERYMNIFNIKNYEQGVVELPYIMWGKNNYFISDAYLLNDEIWLFPLDSQQAVLVYNIEKNKFRENEKITENIKKYPGVVFTYKSIAVCDSCIWMVVLQKNIILKYDYNKDRMEEIRIEKGNLYSIYVCGNKIWLGTLDEEIAVIDKFNYQIEYVSKKLEGLLVKNIVIPIIHSERAVVLSDRESTLADTMIVEIGLRSVLHKIEGYPTLYWCRYREDIMIFPYHSSIFIKVNVQTYNVEILEWKIEKDKISDNYYEEYIKLQVDKNNKIGRIKESIFYDFDNFKTYILRNVNHRKNAEEIKTGKLIYSAIREGKV